MAEAPDMGPREVERRRVLTAGARAGTAGLLGITSFVLPDAAGAASSVVNGVPTSSLVVHLDASQPGGTPETVWQDLSGNGNTAVPGTGVTFEAAAAGTPAHYSFPGTSDAQTTDVGSGAIIGTLEAPPTAYTKMVWFRRDSLANLSNLASSDLGGTFSPHFMHFTGSPRDRLTVGHNTSYSRLRATKAVSAGVWTFGAVTFAAAPSSTGFTLFLNTTDRTWSGSASEISTSTYDEASDALAGPMALHIGSYFDDNLLDGDVATLVVHARDLTQTEVREYYAATVDRFHPV